MSTTDVPCGQAALLSGILGERVTDKLLAIHLGSSVRQLEGKVLWGQVGQGSNPRPVNLVSLILSESKFTSVKIGPLISIS